MRSGDTVRSPGLTSVDAASFLRIVKTAEWLNSSVPSSSESFAGRNRTSREQAVRIVTRLTNLEELLSSFAAERKTAIASFSSSRRRGLCAYARSEIRILPLQLVRHLLMYHCKLSSTAVN